MIRCDYYQQQLCRSCGWITQDYASQLQRKQAQCVQTLGEVCADTVDWLPAVASPATGMRNKAKMAVGGSSADPILGLVELDSEAVDLSRCLLYAASLSAYFPLLKDFIARAALPPYDPHLRRGELKFVLLTEPHPGGPLLLRLVLRSRESLDRITKHLPELSRELPPHSVISVNLQPEHKAVLEGETEILLSEQRWLPVQFNGHRLLLGTQSFLQTNTAVASALYAEAQGWLNALTPARVVDLYCGIGAFAYHAAAPERSVRGVEISAEAIAAANAALPLNQPADLVFSCADAAQSLRTELDAELVIVNPPRRGLGAALCEQLDQAECSHLLYSSCNLDTLSRDIGRLSQFRIRRARLFDMFPHTRHFEVLALLERR